MKQIYSYNTVEGVVTHRVFTRPGNFIARESGFTCELLKKSELDVPGARYFTTPRRAIQAYIARGEVALADASRAEHHKDWRDALAAARRDLRSQIRTRRRV